ncbi:g7869 [Coccomyxa elongata]
MSTTDLTSATSTPRLLSPTSGQMLLKSPAMAVPVTVHGHLRLGRSFFFHPANGQKGAGQLCLSTKPARSTVQGQGSFCC